MSNFQIFDRTTGLLERVLDLRVKNQEVIASNIANAETPGYAPARLDFAASLKSALAQQNTAEPTAPGHIPMDGQGGENLRIKMVRAQGGTGIGDRNGVKLDEEMVAMAENQILYEAATQMINKKLGLLKYVAQDGR